MHVAFKEHPLLIFSKRLVFYKLCIKLSLSYFPLKVHFVEMKTAERYVT